MVDKIAVEIIYATEGQQDLLAVDVEPGTTVEQLIEFSGITEKYPEIDIAKNNKVGIFGKLTKLNTVLREKDRVEIYRPLIADPKEVRRKRAAEGKRMKKGGGDVKDEK